MNAVMACLCDFASTVWVKLHQSTAAPDQSMDALLDTLKDQQIQTELLTQRCVSEARRLHMCGSKALFRAKMLEHRRLQGQLLQLQRYQENVHAQRDALSHHEINQSFVRAMQKAGAKPMLSPEEARDAMEEMQTAVSNAKEMTELLGQPLEDDMPDDDELESEFMETIGLQILNEAPKLPPISMEQQQRQQIAEPVVQRLIVPPAMLVEPAF